MCQEPASSVEREISDTFHAYMRAYFLDRDLKKTLEFLSPELLGFGTGRDERPDRPEDSIALFARDLQQAPGPIQFTVQYLNIMALSGTVGVVLVEFHMDTVIDSQPFRCDNVRGLLVFRKTGDRWLICRLHMSLPSVEQETDESYPLTELAARNRVLEFLVADKTAELSEKNRALTDALQQVKKLSGLLPICMSCKKVRDSEGYWHEVETYIANHSEAEFSHGICDACAEKLYPGLWNPDRDNPTTV